MRRILSQAEQFSWRVANDTPADLVLPPGAATRYQLFNPLHRGLGDPDPSGWHSKWGPGDEEWTYEDLRNSLEISGIDTPVGLDVDPRTGRGVVFDGNHRVSLADELGIEVPVRLNLTDVYDGAPLDEHITQWLADNGHAGRS